MDRGIFIDGRWRKPAGLDCFEIDDPATGEPVGSTFLADEATVDLAVAAAEKAVPVVAGLSGEDRASLLNRGADLVEARVEEMALLLTREQGKPVADNRKEILFGAKVLRYYAGEATRIGGELRPSANPHIKNVVSRYPVGVAAAIVPWNYPVDLYCWKAGPALAAGCPLIVKSPPETPLAIAMLVDCLHKAGLPDGALADLPGHGPIAGAALASHPRVRVISATASIPAGQDIMRNAAGNLKKVCLELGGNAPLIVMADADLEEAARAAHRRAFSNMGQICFYRPTIIDDAPPDSLPMTSETYGPLTAMASFDSVEQMIAMANSLEYGLAAYLYGSDLERMWAIADKLKFGGIGINVNDVSELQAPFGGWKMSGIGRELGPEGLDAYLEPKLLKMRVASANR